MLICATAALCSTSAVDTTAVTDEYTRVYLQGFYL